MGSSLRGEHVLVLGATNPTGLRITQDCAAAGAVVEVLARTPEQAELIGLKLGNPANVFTSSLDFGDPAEVERLAAQVTRERGPVRHVVVCLRYGGRGDAVWGGDGEITDVHALMSEVWLPLLPEGGSFQFHVCGDRPSVGLQPQGPALVADHDARAAAWPQRRIFLLAAGPEDAVVSELALTLAGDPSRVSERLVMEGAFVDDPTWDQLIHAREELDARLRGIVGT